MTDLESIRAREAAATEGPWQWFGNTKMRNVYLATPHSGRKHIMIFHRWGMQCAQPMFRHPQGFMVGLGKLPEAMGPKYEVEYRRDFVGIGHPDATFIAHAREDVAFLLAEHDLVLAELDLANSNLHEARQALLCDKSGLAAALLKVADLAKQHLWLTSDGEWGGYPFEKQTGATLRAEMGKVINETLSVCQTAIATSAELCSAVSRGESQPVAAELARLREHRDAAIQASFGSPAKLHELLVNEDGMFLTASHAGAQLLANHFDAVLKDLDVDNYLEFLFNHEGPGAPILVTLHKPGGKTPHAMRVEAERKVDSLTQQIEAIKVQMTTGYAERDAEINEEGLKLQRLYGCIGEVLSPGEGVSPCEIDAAVADVIEIGNERDEAIRRAEAAEAQRDALLAVLPELEWHHDEDEETGEKWDACPKCMGDKPNHRPGCPVARAKEIPA